MQPTLEISTTSTLDKPPRPSKARRHFLVTKDNVPCGFALPRQFPNRARGVLIKQPDKPHYFTRRCAAERATTRTLAIAAKLYNTLIDGWPKVAPLLEQGHWDVIKAHKP